MSLANWNFLIGKTHLGCSCWKVPIYISYNWVKPGKTLTTLYFEEISRVYVEWNICFCSHNWTKAHSCMRNGHVWPVKANFNCCVASCKKITLYFFILNKKEDWIFSLSSAIFFTEWKLRKNRCDTTTISWKKWIIITWDTSTCRFSNLAYLIYKGTWSFFSFWFLSPEAKTTLKLKFFQSKLCSFCFL